MKTDFLISNNPSRGKICVNLKVIDKLAFSVLTNVSPAVVIKDIKSEEISEHLIHLFIKISIIKKVNNLNDISNKINNLIIDKFMNVLKLKPKNISIFYENDIEK